MIIKDDNSNNNRKNHLPNEEPNHTTFLKLSNSIDIQTLKDLKQGLDDIIKLVEQFKD